LNKAPLSHHSPTIRKHEDFPAQRKSEGQGARRRPTHHCRLTSTSHAASPLLISSIFSVQMPPSRSRLSVPLPSPLLPAHSGAPSSPSSHIRSLSAQGPLLFQHPAQQRGPPSAAQKRRARSQMLSDPPSPSCIHTTRCLPSSRFLSFPSNEDFPAQRKSEGRGARCRSTHRCRLASTSRAAFPPFTPSIFLSGCRHLAAA
jgi:hypothetical protein